MRRRRQIGSPSSNKRFTLPAAIGAAAGYAALEIGIAAAAGLFAWGRAEALLFLAFRPWLLLLAAALVARYPLRDRLIFYALALGLAAASETVLLFSIGATDPWPLTLRGVAGGAGLLVLFEAALQIGCRLIGRWGRPVVTVLLAFLLLTPWGLRGYDTAVIGEEERPQAGQAPDLMLMTALPIIWGEKGAFDPSSRPAAAYTELQREFAVRPLDVLDPPSLAKGRLLLLAQPRLLAPEELVALDEWVRAGGRALVLTDPSLVWPSELSFGDARRPPPIGLLDPLLTHWGLALEPPERRALVTEQRPVKAVVRRLVMAAPGTFRTNNSNCQIEASRHIARCRIGGGKVTLIADADLLEDSLWAGPGEGGERRHRRLSDNPLVVADLLDELGDVNRSRAAGEVQWAEPDAPWQRALLLAALPLVAALLIAALLRLRRKKSR